MEGALRHRPDAKLLLVGRDGSVRREPRSNFAALLRAGDLVVANDAATIPASLWGRHIPTGRSIELRLAARASLAIEAARSFRAVVFGEGDFHTTTERRLLDLCAAAALP